MIHLQSITLKRPETLPPHFPFTIPVIQSLTTLAFSHDITFFVGENGSGKSTLLEAIAVAAQLPAIGSEAVDQDATLKDIRELSNQLQWAWTKRTRRGFFMRSEDFFGFAKKITQTHHELKADLAAVDTDYAHRNQQARNLAKMPFARELHALNTAYGAGLDAQSHGESYFKLFKARFVPGGLYLLDEPEAPLSPARQLAFIALWKEMVALDAQFIIATHSPLLLAYPGATIYSFDEGKIQAAAYDDLEHVRLTRSFLNNPQAYLRHLMA
jgi:predicted ATPase